MTSLALLGAVACGEAPPEVAAVAAAVTTPAETVLAPTSLTFSKGTLPGGQSVGALATKQLSGTTDTWSAYVEFNPGSQAVAQFALPAGSAPPSSLSLRTNYRGPARSTMTWRFEALDTTTGAWVALGDNGFAKSWTWSAATMSFPAPVARFVDGTGRISVRYGTDSSADASDVDELVVLAGASTTTPPATTPPSTTPPPSSEPPPSTTPPATTPPPAAGTYWQPRPGTSWQIQLQGTLDTSINASVYDIDLFDTSASTIAALRAQGRKVICYFSAGSYEDWRSDAGQFPAAVRGKALDGWPGEAWLDTRSSVVRSIMQKRMDLAVSKGCDAVDPDNVDGYTNNPGFPLTAATQLDYNTFLANAAHARGLAVGLKNDLAQIGGLVGLYDFAVNEQCQVYNECNLLRPFITANKPVFGIEYEGSTSSVCPAANAANFDTLIKNLSLDARRTACR